jgi:hypothetical protein
MLAALAAHPSCFIVRNIQPPVLIFVPHFPGPSFLKKHWPITGDTSHETHPAHQKLRDYFRPRTVRKNALA